MRAPSCAPRRRKDMDAYAMYEWTMHVCVCSGASAYTRHYDYPRMRAICDKVRYGRVEQQGC